MAKYERTLGFRSRFCCWRCAMSDWKAHIYNLTSVKEYQNILPYLSRTLKTQRSWQVKYIFPTNYTNYLPKKKKTRGVKARSLCYTTFPTQLCRIWFNWGAEKDIEKWIVSRPSAIGVYVCTYIPTDRLSVTKVQDNFGCVAPYTRRGYVSVPEASRLSQCSPIHWAAVAAITKIIVYGDRRI